jgi:phosphatidylglycerophosphatase A
LKRFATTIAMGFYLSYIPVRLLKFLPWSRSLERPDRRWTGAGFVGTLLGWACMPVLPEEPWRYGTILVLGILGACWASDVAERVLGQKDDSRIIIDEVVGYWTTIAFLPRNWKYFFAAFVLFRIFDTVKLPPYRWLERLPGGYGVVMDDVGAGVLANLILQVVRFKGLA